MSRLNEIYGEVVKRYRDSHNDSISGLSTEMNKLTNSGKTWEEAVLYYALELGVKIPEVEKLVDGGMSQEGAILAFSKTLAIEQEIHGVYNSSQPSSTQEYKSSPSRLWYLIPLLFGLLGGLVGYTGVKNEDRGMANNLLTVGIIMTLIDSAIYYYVFYIWLPSVIFGYV